MKRFYLPQLDGIRFLAFLLVFFHHAPSATPLFAAGSFGARFCDWFQGFGWVGVDLFLVLSAYLITTLLLLEHEAAGRISLRDFYVRRILRIWPIYYLMVAIGFVVLPAFGYLAVSFGDPRYRAMISDFLFPYLTFFGNFAIGRHLYPPVWTLSHLWTVALEEQFYILWPPLLILVLRFRRQAIWVVLPLLFAGTVAARAWLAGHSIYPMIWTNTASRLDPLVFGIALAFWRQARPARRAPLLRLLEFCAGALIAASITLGPNVFLQTRHQIWQFAATAVGFTLLLDASIGEGPAAWLFSRRWLVWLGRLTYGLYVYHILGLQIGGQWAIRLAIAAGLESAWTVWLLNVGVCLALTIAVAAISYYTYETFFLRMKSRFAHVASQPAPGEPVTRPAAAPAPAGEAG